MQWSWYPVGGGVLVALVAIALLLLGGLVRASGVTVAQRRVLLGLRLAVVLLLITALLRPTLVYTSVRRQSATLLFVVDRSRSMQVADAYGDQSRWQALCDALVDSRDVLASLARDLEVRLYAMDQGTELVDFDPAAATLDLEPLGSQTAIGAALDDVQQREAGKRLAALILLSDGNQRALAPRDIPPQLPARRLADQGVPLHTVVLGQARGTGQSRDVALTQFDVDETVFVRNEMLAVGTLRIDGLVDQPIPVELLFETTPGQMVVVDSTQVRATSDGELVPVELKYAPQVPGEYKVTLRAVPQPGEAATLNNELSGFVTVRSGGLNVLYLEGAIREESRFLRRALDASPDMKVDFVRLLADAAAPRPAALAQAFAPGKYNVYLLGDLDSSALRADELESLARAVDVGAGLGMLGGFQSFGAGGYQATPLADLLPIEMTRLERQRRGDPISADLHLAGPLSMVPTELGRDARIMQLAPAERNRELWSKLPPLDGANRFRGVKPAASILAATEPAGGQPLLVTQVYGGGRVLAFAGDSTWRWWMHGFADEHRRFWRQAVLWLAQKDDSSDGEVWIRLAERRVRQGQRVEFYSGARQADGQPDLEAQLEAHVVLPDGTRQTVRLGREGPQMVGALIDTEQPGDYAIEVSATRGGTLLGHGRARFLVYEQDLEMDNPVADPSLLAGLSEITGGESISPEELRPLLERLRETPLDLQIETLSKSEPWDSWPFFVLVVVLLSSEWWLRKRWGLV